MSLFANVSRTAHDRGTTFNTNLVLEGVYIELMNDVSVISTIHSQLPNYFEKQVCNVKPVFAQ